MTSRRRGLILLISYLVLMAAAVWHTRRPGPRKAPSSSKETIAVIEIKGPITSSAGDSFGGMDVDRLVRRLSALRGQPEVKAVLLRIDSPGGSVAAVQEIHQEVVALRKAGKIVVSSFGDVAASGGYYIASASDKIVANPGTLTGSIGVLFQLGNVEGLFKKVGVRMETIKSGSMKDAGSPFRALSPRERELFQGLVSDAYDQFFRAVAEGRGLPKPKLRLLADGRVFTGSQAKAAGLVDELGNFETAVRVARELAGIKAEKPPLVYSVPPWERLFSIFGTQASHRLAMPWPPQKRVRFEYVWE
jgi:protease-4